MKKTFKLFIIFLILTICFSGCGQQLDQQANKGEKINTDLIDENKREKIVIVGIYKSGEQIWFIDEGAASEKIVKDMGADEFIYIDAKMNSDIYLQAIDNIIAQQVDGVITCIPDQKLSQLTVDKLKEASIPVIATGAPLVDDRGNLLAPYVGIDSTSIGKMNGDWMANYILKNDLFGAEDIGLLVMTMNSVTTCIPRTEGEVSRFFEMIPSFPKEMVYYCDYNGETEEGFEAALRVFEDTPQVKKWLVMTANEEGAVGATRALEQKKMDLDSCVIGLGAYLAKNEFKKNYSAMKAASYFTAESIGGTAARALMSYILYGTDIQEEHLVNAVIVTRDNYKEVMGDDAQ